MEYILPRVNSNINYGLWVIIMYQCSFIICSEYVTLVGDVDNGEGYACVGAVGKWKTYLLLNCACNLKLSLKK